ncbi:MAG: bacteriophage Gp15 family protein [Bacteroides sp.]|nr:bacteriophage Gp15 family protein [Eubacterium sp.]MCM1419625.1 bacteriophage Gp15 family protein [Roseburia sp.]MCM1462963.1 bacteriophage Gp15 family protein [Bacteroides sp.]
MKEQIYSIDKPFPETIAVGGKSYRLNLSFDRVIRFYELMRDRESAFSDEERLEIAYAWLVKRPRRAKRAEKIAVIRAVMETRLTLTERTLPQKRKERTAIGYIEDSPYLYAAFRQVYGIDLFRERGKLHWWKFLAMLDSLPPDCKLKEIMAIRTRELPKFNGRNAEEIDRIREQQQYYFLDVNFEEAEAEANDGANRLFEALLLKAKEGEAYGGKRG